jgi:hypothetical protein
MNSRSWGWGVCINQKFTNSLCPVATAEMRANSIFVFEVQQWSNANTQADVPTLWQSSQGSQQQPEPSQDSEKSQKKKQLRFCLRNLFKPLQRVSAIWFTTVFPGSVESFAPAFCSKIILALSIGLKNAGGSVVAKISLELYKSAKGKRTFMPSLPLLQEEVRCCHNLFELTIEKDPKICKLLNVKPG